MKKLLLILILPLILTGCGVGEEPKEDILTDEVIEQGLKELQEKAKSEEELNQTCSDWLWNNMTRENTGINKTGTSTYVMGILGTPVMEFSIDEEGNIK